jgi:DNA processing protein
MLALNQFNPLIGARRAHALLQRFGSAEGLFAAGQNAWRAVRLSDKVCTALDQPDWQKVDTALAWADHPNRHILVFGQAGYPEQLAHISDPPLVLYVEGDPAVLAQAQLALVGSRHPTPTGYETAMMLASSLSRIGFVVCSGMALGIDAAAHQGALAAGGATVAVTGTGLDIVYPSRHAALAEQISHSGCLVSEYPLGTQALGRNFPLRNRIISGLSRGVIVVEAALQSGSLITARQALEQGREVYAVPGSIHSPTSRGCHWLLREGAKLVENVEDILAELDPSVVVQEAPPQPRQLDAFAEMPEADYERVLAAVDYVPTSVDRIVERCGLTADAVCSMLLILELYNIVHISSSGLYCRSAGRLSSESSVNECGLN